MEGDTAVPSPNNTSRARWSFVGRPPCLQPGGCFSDTMFSVLDCELPRGQHWGLRTPTKPGTISYTSQALDICLLTDHFYFISIYNSLLSTCHFIVCWMKGSFYLVLGSSLFCCVCVFGHPFPSPSLVLKCDSLGKYDSVNWIHFRANFSGTYLFL